MAKIILLESDIWGTLVRAVKPKGIKGRKLPFSVSLDVDSDAYGAVQKDALLQAKITEAASEKYKTYMKVMALSLKQHDAAYQKAKDQKMADKVLAAFEKDFEANTKPFVADAQKAAQKAWDEVKKTKEEYQKYKIIAGIDLGLDSLSLAGGIVGSVGAVATGGWGLIVALYGTIKTLISVAMKVYKLAIDANKMQKRVNAGLKEVQKRYDRKRKELSGAKDTGAALINSILGSDFISSLTTIKSDNDQYHRKLQGVDVGAHKLAQELNRVLAKVDKIASMPEAKNSKKMKLVLKKLQGATADLIKKIIKMQEEIAKGNAFHQKTSRAIKELQSMEPKKWKYIQKGLPIGDIILAGGDFAKAGEALLGIATAAATEADKQLLDKV